MKINKIFISGLAMLALTSCSDFLDVESATDNASTEFAYSTNGEVSTALNGVYAKLLSDETFGRKLYETFQLNSDVDFAANANEAAAGNQPRRFDVRSDAGNVETLWNNLYSSVETANEFIYNLSNSDIYEEGTTTEMTEDADGRVDAKTVPAITSLTQMMGEAKVMRAMFYHELLSYWGDIPFTLQATYESDNLLPEVTDRQAVSDALIEDLEHAAEYMYSDQDAQIAAPERISKEAAYAMIARLALQAGGYSLNHDANDVTNYKMTRPSDYKKYYEIARDYTKRIIDAGGHALTKSYRDVFIDECNFIVTKGDDPIFEIPFAQGSTSCWGYYQGPSNGVDTGDEADYSNSQWGSTNGGVRTTALYRYSFDESDLRRDYICGMWYYSNQGLPTLRFDYSMHNNKWSKLWNTNGLGKATTSSTGINFAYIRYTDVLLMFAEADNEVNNGPTQDAKDALKTVRKRAFAPADYAEKVEAYVDAANSKDAFLNLVLDERKWEFAGENMRWKDLVRNNKYSEAVFYTFLGYLSIAEADGGSARYLEMVEEHDGVVYSDVRANDIWYAHVKNYDDPNFPNRSVYMLYILNPFGTMQQPTGTPNKYFEDNELPYEAVSERSITGLTSSSTNTDWKQGSVSWVDNNGNIRPQCLYSMFGYARVDNRNNIVVVDNGVASAFNINTADPEGTVNRLPAVRYLLPYPQEAIARSSGVYKNYYGY